MATPVDAPKLSSYLYVAASTPWHISKFLLQVLVFLVPWTRPSRGWSWNQAVRVQVISLVLHYWSYLRLGDKLRLRPGREKDRFVVVQPASEKLYQGPALDGVVVPQPIGVTWTPSLPRGADAGHRRRVALHFHGGAYVIGNGRDEDTGYTAQTLIQHMGCSHVCTPQYRLASSAGSETGRFPAPLQDALTAYTHLVKRMGISPKQIVLSGDSAGANMALMLLRYLDAHGETLGLPMPAAAALWSPWLDVGAALRQNIADSPNYATDYLNGEFSRWGATSISGFGAVDPEGPYLAPLHHPFPLPVDLPVFLQAGDCEVLHDDIRAFADKVQTLGWTVGLTVSKHCPHDIILLGGRMGFAKEAEKAAREARTFFWSKGFTL
jgi:acetyl esterase/lipase